MITDINKALDDWERHELDAYIEEWAASLRARLEDKPVREGFDPSEPRDESGQWTSGGGGHARNEDKPKLSRQEREQKWTSSEHKAEKLALYDRRSDGALGPREVLVKPLDDRHSLVMWGTDENEPDRESRGPITVVATHKLRASARKQKQHEDRQKKIEQKARAEREHVQKAFRQRLEPKTVESVQGVLQHGAMTEKELVPRLADQLKVSPEKAEDVLYDMLAANYVTRDLRVGKVIWSLKPHAGAQGVREAFDPSEPRDESGKWTAVGASLQQAHPFPAPMPAPPAGMMNPKMRAENPELEKALQRHDEWTGAYHRAFTAAAIDRMLNQQPHKPIPLPSEDAPLSRKLSRFQKAADEMAAAAADVIHLGPEFEAHHQAAIAAHPEGGAALAHARKEARRRYEMALDVAVQHLAGLPVGPDREKAQRILKKATLDGHDGKQGVRESFDPSEPRNERMDLVPISEVEQMKQPIIHVELPPIHVPTPEVKVFVEAPPPAQVNVSLPEIKVNIEPPPPAEVNVNTPEVKVNIEPPPPAEVNVTMPEINVNMEREPHAEATEIMHVERDKKGLIKSTTREIRDSKKRYKEITHVQRDQEGRIVSTTKEIQEVTDD